MNSSGVNCVDFMASVSDQTKVIQQGLKTLRGEVDNPMRVLDIGQEAIVLSGLNKSAGESLKNIKNLYDETKYLKLYLEKVIFIIVEFHDFLYSSLKPKCTMI